jgi:Ti-type conjugative transfer relaxase TraA
MAIYDFSAKLISRANGSSALAAAACRCAGRLHDQRLDRTHDLSNKAGVVHSEVMLPDGAPEAWRDRERLWNAVEKAELRKDAQLAREVEFAIPRELDRAEGVGLAREFVQREFVARGMVADLNVHWDMGEDGQLKPHAHVMLTTRSIGDEGFGPKVRDWNATHLLEHWRGAWADHVNTRLAELDIDARVDHRTLEAQGIDLEPQNKIGPAASRMGRQGLASERLDEHAEIARDNGARNLADPRVALDAITHGQATFTIRDLARFVHRHSDGQEQFDKVAAAVRASPELVRLGRDGQGEERFTSKGMLATEQRLEAATVRLDAHRRHGLSRQVQEAALVRSTERGLTLSSEQEAAYERVTDARGLSVVVGYAGTGKSAMLGVARDAWEGAGYTVRGAALSGIAAENLEGGSGIASRTLASLEHQWAQGRELLTARDVLVIDEAGMIGARQMARVVADAEKRQAKLVLVGDPEQLQAGAAFRSVHERHGGVEIMNVRRQRAGWQRDATRQLATGRTAEAIAAYEQHGHIHAAPTREAARVALVDGWDRDRQEAPSASRLILTHSNDEVHALNQAARDRLKRSGALGPEVEFQVERGSRAFAPGDRVMFLKNERGLRVKNGSLGQIESVTPVRLAVLLDEGRAVAFDLKNYAYLDHGYAATIHKAQGVTVDRVHVLATPGLDRHAAYVALSRHRDSVQLHYGQDDFAGREQLTATLGRERAKNMAGDYAPAFADRRGIRLPAPATPARGIFDGLRFPARDLAADQVRPPAHDLGPATEPLTRTPAPLQPELPAMVERHGRIVRDMRFARSVGDPYTAEQRTELTASREALDALRPYGARDLETAMAGDPRLIGEVAAGRTASVIRAMQLEAELRTDPQRRADSFVQRWQALDRQRRLLLRDREDSKAGKLADRMLGMAKGLERDPQVESLLRIKRQQLGLAATAGGSIGRELGDLVGRGRSRGLGL